MKIKGFEEKCICSWSKDNEFGFIPNINCPVHGKEVRKLISKSVPCNKSGYGKGYARRDDREHDLCEKTPNTKKGISKINVKFKVDKK